MGWQLKLFAHEFNCRVFGHLTQTPYHQYQKSLYIMRDLRRFFNKYLTLDPWGLRPRRKNMSKDFICLTAPYWIDKLKAPCAERPVIGETAELP